MRERTAAAMRTEPLGAPVTGGIFVPLGTAVPAVLRLMVMET
jgi:hypothetical protein